MSAQGILKLLRDRELDGLAKRIAGEHHVTLVEMFTERATPASHARHAFWHALFDTGHWSKSRIGVLCGVDRSTVSYGIDEHVARINKKSQATTTTPA